MTGSELPESGGTGSTGAACRGIWLIKNISVNPAFMRDLEGEGKRISDVMEYSCMR